MDYTWSAINTDATVICETLCKCKEEKKETDRRTEREQKQAEDRGGVGGNENEQSPFL